MTITKSGEKQKVKANEAKLIRQARVNLHTPKKNLKKLEMKIKKQW